MRGQLGVIRPVFREVLEANWSIAATSPNSLDEFNSPDESAWIKIDQLLPVAAALRALHKWSLAQPPTRFDGQDWWYRLHFDAPQAHAGEQCVLGLDGLATVATVWLNGSEILHSDNMFVAHECDISTLIQPNGNTLLMRFSSLDNLLAIRRKRPRWRAPMMEHQQLRWFRTTVLGRTPGWSPPAAVVGPWKDIWIERRQSFALSGVRLDTKVRGTVGVLQCNFDVQGLGGNDLESAEIRMTGQGHEFTQIFLKRAVNGYLAELRIPDVVLWWPHTHGDPHLYAITLVVRAKGATEDVAFDLGRVGFRTVGVDSSNGNFSVSVNGVHVFCRGACWSPLDPVTLRASASDYKSAIKQVQTAGMNMLRVAGTMVYEDDAFFDACDEHGILVWQDFMFANMDYPSDDPAFMQSVETEVKQQLHRIRARACLAVLCGNSEVSQQAAMWGASRELWNGPLFDVVLAECCANIASGVPYWPSSAFGGAFPHQGDVGTTSYYGVGAYMRTFDDSRRSKVKFATECLALANVPADSAIERMPGGLSARVHQSGWKTRSPRDLGAGWDFDDVRDHYLSVLFKTDPHKLRYADHDRYLTLSRITSGEVMAAALSEWRLTASVCGGAIVLFLRDLWAGAGWGILDDQGVPKACYHYLKRTLLPVTVVLSDEGCNGLQACLINESRQGELLTLNITAWRTGDVVVASGEREFDMPAHSTQSVSCMDLLDQFIDLTYAYRFGPPQCDVVVATLRTLNNVNVGQAFYFPMGLCDRAVQDVGLDAQATMLDECMAEVTVRTNHFAQCVNFRVPGYEADEDFFHLAPQSTMSTILRAKRPKPLIGTVSAINSLVESQLRVATPQNK